MTLIVLIIGGAFFLGSFYGWMSASRVVRKAMGPVIPAGAGLTASVNRVIVEEMGESIAPSVFESRSSQANAWILPGREGKHIWVLTRGLLAMLTEEELRAVLGHLWERSCVPGLRRRTVSASVAIRILRWAPSEWTALIFLGARPDPQAFKRSSAPLRFGWFLVIYPGVRFVLNIGSDSRRSPTSATGSVALDTAMRKICLSAYSSDFIGHPALSSLYLCPPRPLSEAFSLRSGLVSKGHQG